MLQGEQTTTIDLIRHGEPVGGRLFRGSQDDTLSATGWRQMRAATTHVPWQRIIASPLLRCCEFARELAEQHGIPSGIERDYREIHFGLWEGLSAAEVLQKWPDLLDKVWSDPLAHSPPEGETLTDFAARVSRAWDAMLHHHAGEHLLLPSHGGTIRVILCHTIGLPLDRMWCLDVQYASLTRLRAWHQADGTIRHTLISHASPLSQSPSGNSGEGTQ